MEEICPPSLPTGRIFIKIYILEFFNKSVENIQFWIKSDKNDVYYTW